MPAVGTSHGPRSWGSLPVPPALPHPGPGCNSHECTVLSSPVERVRALERSLLHAYPWAVPPTISNGGGGYRLEAGSKGPLLPQGCQRSARGLGVGGLCHIEK